MEQEKRVCNKCGSVVVKETDEELQKKYKFYCIKCGENLFEFETHKEPTAQSKKRELEKIIKQEEETKEILFDLFSQYDEAEQIINALRDYQSADVITSQQYDEIMENYEELLKEWKATQTTSETFQDISREFFMKQINNILGWGEYEDNEISEEEKKEIVETLMNTDEIFKVIDQYILYELGERTGVKIELE